MKMLFSHWVSFFIWIITIYTISMILICSMQINNAGEFFSQVIHRIETSYYSEDVIRVCEQKAIENGYSLLVEDETIYDDRKDLKVTLTYKIKIPLFHISKTESYIGYAR